MSHSQIRKVIARRLLESKQGTPQHYLSVETCIDATLALRKVLKEKHGAAVSVNDFVVKALAMALKEVPAANCYFDEGRGEVVPWPSVDVSVAVASERGLITPIVKNADKKSLTAISAEMKELAEKARSGRLKPEEFEGGSFSVSNLGMFPVDRFCAIVNPPQVKGRRCETRRLEGWWPRWVMRVRWVGLGVGAGGDSGHRQGAASGEVAGGAGGCSDCDGNHAVCRFSSPGWRCGGRVVCCGGGQPGQPIEAAAVRVGKDG